MAAAPLSSCEHSSPVRRNQQERWAGYLRRNCKQKLLKTCRLNHQNFNRAWSDQKQWLISRIPLKSELPGTWLNLDFKITPLENNAGNTDSFQWIRSFGSWVDSCSSDSCSSFFFAKESLLYYDLITAVFLFLTMADTVSWNLFKGTNEQSQNCVQMSEALSPFYAL